MRSGSNPASISVRMLLTVAFALLPLYSARADYVVRPGDTLEITVSGAPALTRRVLVDSNGNATLPLVGELKATEAPLSELRQRLETMLKARNVVRNPDVVISVYEYGPIYVDGDVSRPGEYRFRPEMTVRSAIAVAGGLDTLNRLGAEVRSNFITAGIQLVKQETRAARLRAELANEDTFQPPMVGTIPGVDASVLEEIAKIELQQMEADRTNVNRERAYLSRMLTAAQEQVAALEQEKTQEQATFDQQLKDTARSRELLQRGVGTFVRTQDLQLAQAQVQAHILEVQARLAEARRVVEENSHSVETFDERRQAKLLEELQDAVTEAGKARSWVQAARERFKGRAGTFSTADGSVPPQATVRRMAGGAVVKIPAKLDMSLQSGDTVEVLTAEAHVPTGDLSAPDKVDP